VFAKNDSGKREAIKADKIYQMKYKKIDITSKNIVLNKTRRKKRYEIQSESKIFST
jgi:hypothetical protein